MSSVIRRFQKHIESSTACQHAIHGTKVLYGFIATQISSWVPLVIANIIVHEYLPLYEIGYGLYDGGCPDFFTLFSTRPDSDNPNVLDLVVVSASGTSSFHTNSKHLFRVQMNIPSTGFVCPSHIVLQEIHFYTWYGSNFEIWSTAKDDHQRFHVFMESTRNKITGGHMKALTRDHDITLNSPWFEHVITGRKRYEGRRLTGNVKEWRIGDRLLISHHSDKTKARFAMTIVNTEHFQTFEHALHVLGLAQVLPDVSTIEEGVEIYKKFVSLPTQLKDGVCMVELGEI